MENNLFGVASSSTSSSSSTNSHQGSSSNSFASATQMTAEGSQTIAASATSSDPAASSAQASASATPEEITATAVVGYAPIEPVASALITTSPATDILALFPGLSDVAVESLQSSNVIETPSSPVPIVDYVLGTAATDIVVGQAGRHVMVGTGEADTFVLGAAGVETVTQANVIVDCHPMEGDRLGLSGGITISDLHLQVVDLDHNGVPESTVIRLGASDSILAVALNTVDPAGYSLLNNDCFLSIPNPFGYQE